jgi:GTP-binding protein
MADIPGTIEGAHLGKGLGLRFLRHIERNSILLFLIPSNSENIVNEYNILLNELRQYNPQLLQKKRIVAISKADLLSIEEEKQLLHKLKDINETCIIFSSVSQKNVQKLKRLLWETLNTDTLSE